VAGVVGLAGVVGVGGVVGLGGVAGVARVANKYARAVQPPEKPRLMPYHPLICQLMRAGVTGSRSQNELRPVSAMTATPRRAN
jgi:hypothetical protein